MPYAGQLIELRDGRQAIVDMATLSPEGKAWIKANTKPETLPDVLKSALSGVVEGAVRLPAFGGDAVQASKELVNRARPGTFDNTKPISDTLVEGVEDLTGLKRYHPGTAPGRYAGAAGGAVGSGLTLRGLAGATGVIPKTAGSVLLGAPPVLAPSTITSPIKTALTTPLALDAASGLAAQAGADMSGGNPLVAALAGVGTGVGGAALANARTPNAAVPLHHAAKTVTPAEWAQAERDLGKFQRAGSTSYTLADVLPESSGVGNLASGVSNSVGGELLRQKLSQRVTQDLPDLVQRNLDTMHPQPVSGMTLTAPVAQAAQSRMKMLEDQRTRAFQSTIQNGPPVAQADIAQALAAITAKSGAPGVLGTGSQKSLDAAAEALRGAPLYPQPQPPGTQLALPGQPVQPPPAVMAANLEALSKRVADLKAGTQARMPDALAHNEAKAALRGIAPAYGQAMDDYVQFTQNVLNPERQGLVGQTAALAGKGAGQGTLPSVLARGMPQDFQAALPHIAPTQSVQQQLARLLGQENPQPVKNPLLGAPTMRARENINTIMQGVDPARARQIAERFEVIDKLSKLTAERGVDSSTSGVLSASPLRSILGPFGETSRRIGLSVRAEETANIARLLTDPTPANLAVLRRIAENDPQIAAKLRLATGMIAPMAAVPGAAENAPKQGN